MHGKCSEAHRCLHASTLQRSKQADFAKNQTRKKEKEGLSFARLIHPFPNPSVLDVFCSADFSHKTSLFFAHVDSFFFVVVWVFFCHMFVFLPRLSIMFSSVHFWIVVSCTENDALSFLREGWKWNETFLVGPVSSQWKVGGIRTLHCNWILYTHTQLIYNLRWSTSSRGLRQPMVRHIDHTRHQSQWKIQSSI